MGYLLAFLSEFSMAKLSKILQEQALPHIWKNHNFIIAYTARLKFKGKAAWIIVQLLTQSSDHRWEHSTVFGWYERENEPRVEKTCSDSFHTHPKGKVK